MTHQTRPTPARRMYVEPSLFQYSDTEIARRDQQDEDRRNTPRYRTACRFCLDRGCPDCDDGINRDYSDDENE